MRTPIAGLCDRIAEYLDNTPRPVPIINAGSGPDEHPTQALLDIYTLNRGFKEQGIDNKTITMVGDLKRGRTVRSLARLLTNYEGIKLRFASPKEFRINDDLRDRLKKAKVSFEETEDFEGAIAGADAIYMTRVQDEYDVNQESKAIDYKKFHLKYEHLKLLKPDAIIMHPFPRREEIDVAIDNDPRAKYWRQERNGMWTRVALITKILGVDNKILLPEL
jgi:aspartate carbamoyltransferase catalytic subunit